MTEVFYRLLFAFAWLVSLLPFWLLYRISDLLFIIIYYIAGYRRKTVFANLKKAFPEKTVREMEKIARAFYRHFCDFFLESIKGISIPVKEIDSRFNFQNLENIHELATKQKSFALVSGHYNNWEWMIRFPARITHKFFVIYRPLKNKPVDMLIKHIRSRYNALMVPMDQIWREALKCYNSKELFCIWFLADQRPPKSNKFWTRFLNQETSFYLGVEKMAQKLGLAVVFMHIDKVKRGHYEISFKILFDDASVAGENEITLACIREIENEIRQKPEYWLWSHKRFKHHRPDDVKLVLP
jgi:KDO2-lipid IV(A) lauroyltransferase